MLARVIGAVSATTEPAEGAIHGVHRDARNRPVLETWLVPSMGHAWSGGDSALKYHDELGPDASALMMEFFSGIAERNDDS
jgi:poly(3-hydroxybutyrate) depolymerase